MLEEVYFSLGTNLGNREKNINEALFRMQEAFSCSPVAVSDFLETEPWGFCSENRFINCVARFDIDMNPEAILKTVKSIEERMGRDTRDILYDISGRRVYQSRIIDIDILLCGKLRYDSETLHIPHLLMAKRDFVMIPLRQIVSEKTMSSFHDIFGE